MRAVGEDYCTVSEAAERAGVTRKAIRVYEEKGLLRPPERTAAGYRLFSDEDVRVLQFIRQAKTLGLALSEISDILNVRRGGGQTCDHVTGLLDAHLTQIDRAMADLRRLKSSLQAVRRGSADVKRSGCDALVCQIIERPS